MIEEYLVAWSPKIMPEELDESVAAEGAGAHERRVGRHDALAGNETLSGLGDQRGLRQETSGGDTAVVIANQARCIDQVKQKNRQTEDHCSGRGAELVRGAPRQLRSDVLENALGPQRG